MKPTLRAFALFTVVLALPSFALATSVADVVKAQAILAKVVQLTKKYQQYNGVVQAPEPLANNGGQYQLPYGSNGALTEWANKTLNVQVGAIAGEKAGELAGNAVASRVPFGGLMGGAFKKKGKQLGAVAAVGGPEFIKKSSDRSFNNLDDYAVYLHVKHSADGGYASALAAAMAIYPGLEKSYDAAIQKAYANAAKTATVPVVVAAAATAAVVATAETKATK